MNNMLNTYRMHLKREPIKVIVMTILLVLAVLFLQRFVSGIVLKKETKKAAVPVVNVIHPIRTSKDIHVVIPGNVMAWHEAPIFARAKGYLKYWNVDIGYRVKRGDVLAVIERPELDAALEEAEDYLNVIEARSKLAQITAKRWENLVKTDSVSKQANDDKNYSAQAQTANVSRAKATVEKLRAFVSFEEVVAPFDGIISRRETDIGALINIGSHPAQEKPLFRIVQTNPLRLYVNIPQTYVSLVTPNMSVNLRFAEYPGQQFHGKLLKTAGAIDPMTLTLQAEFEVQNKEGILLPGGYTSVDFILPSYPHGMIVPVNALLFRAEGLQVATIDKEQRIHLKSVEVGTDFGKSIQINNGLSSEDLLVLNPFDSIFEGQKVNVHLLALDKKDL